MSVVGGLLDRSAAAAERCLASSTLSGQPWGPAAYQRPGSSGRGAGCCTGRAKALGAGPAPPASPRGQRPRWRRNPGRHCHRHHRLLSLPVSVAAAAASVAPQGRGRRWGHRGAPVDAPPAASRVAPPRGDEAPAVKMEVTCLLLLALIPFHCRGQGVYGKSPRPAPRRLNTARKLCKRGAKRALSGFGGDPGSDSGADARVPALFTARADGASCFGARRRVVGSGVKPGIPGGGTHLPKPCQRRGWIGTLQSTQSARETPTDLKPWAGAAALGYRNLVLPWLGLGSESGAMHDPELRTACRRAGCQHRDRAAGSPSPLLLRLRFFYFLLDSQGGCQHPPDWALKTPASLFGPLLNQFFLSPVPSYKNPAPPSFSLRAHTDTFSHRPQETQTRHALLGLRGQTLPSATQPCSSVPTPGSPAPGVLWFLLPSLPCFSGERS